MKNLDMPGRKASWAILQGDAWSLISNWSLNQESEESQERNRILIKYIYTFNKNTDLQGRQLTGKSISINDSNSQKHHESNFADSRDLLNVSIEKRKCRNISNDSGYPSYPESLSDDEPSKNTELVCKTEKTNILKKISEANQSFLPHRLFQLCLDEHSKKAHHFEDIQVSRRIFNKKKETILSAQQQNACGDKLERHDKKKNKATQKFNHKIKSSMFAMTNASPLKSSAHPGLIVKYIYYLSAIKNAEGHPITWKPTNSRGYDINNYPAKSSKREVARKRLNSSSVVKYEFASTTKNLANPEKSYQRLDDRKTNSSFSLSLKQSTFFLPSSSALDKDLHQIISHSELNSNQTLPTDETSLKRGQPGNNLLQCHRIRSDSQSNGDSSLSKSLLGRSTSLPSNNACLPINNACLPINNSYLPINNTKQAINSPSLSIRDEKLHRNASGKTHPQDTALYSSSEGITFKATLGFLSYQAVFLLDDDIRNLKTFVHLISGLPPSRQKYLASDDHTKKTHKKQNRITIRQLGFKDGDVVQLEVRET